jgi:hypothetical protein
MQKKALDSKGENPKTLFVLNRESVLEIFRNPFTVFCFFTNGKMNKKRFLFDCWGHSFSKFEKKHGQKCH